MRWAAAGELIAGKIPVASKYAQWVGFRFEDYLPEASTELGRQITFEEGVATYEPDADGYLKPFTNVLNGGTEGYKFNVDRDYLFPIPTTQLTLNPKLGQNPGW